MVGGMVIGSLRMPDSEAFYLGHFGRLLPSVRFLWNDPDPAFLRERNGETRFGDGVHGSGHQRNVQGNVAREFRLEADVARENAGMGGMRRTSSNVSAFWITRMALIPLNQIRIIRSAAPAKALSDWSF